MEPARILVTSYRLTCGHIARVPGPHGATTGRAWCNTCEESRPVTGGPCELCGTVDGLPDAHGTYCQPCRDADPGAH